MRVCTIAISHPGSAEFPITSNESVPWHKDASRSYLLVFPRTAALGSAIPVRPRLSFHLAWACMEAANCARRYDPLIKRFTQCKQAKTNTLVATKTVAHTWARACYDIMHDQMPFEVQKALRVCTPLRVGWGGELASGVGAKPLSLMSHCPILPPASV